MIHRLSKEVTASCAFMTGIWDSLGARSEGQQTKHPSWHTKLVLVWIRSKHLKTHYSKLQLKSLVFLIRLNGISLLVERELIQISIIRNVVTARTPKITNKL